MNQPAGDVFDSDWALENITPASRAAGCRIIPLLRKSPRTYTKLELAESLGVSIASVRRALKWLTYLGAPVEDCPSRGGWWLPDRAWSVPWDEMDDAAKIVELTRIIAPGAKTTLVDCVSRLQRENLALRAEIMKACTMPQIAIEPTPAQAPTLTAVEPETASQTLERGERELPPDRHRSECVKVRFGQTSVYFHVGFYPDGRICEASIDMAKAGDALRGWATSVSKMASHYIQIGGDIETIADSLRHIHFEPAGPNFADEYSKAVVSNATSIVDAFAQALLAYSQRGE